MDARAAGMGNAMTAQQLSSSAMFYNPASMAFIENTVDVYLGQTNWIADVVYNAGSIAWNSPIGIIGLHGVFVNYGDILETVRADNDKGFVDIGTFSPSESVIGIGYAQSLTDRFSVGGNIKYAQQDLGEATIEMNESGDPVKEAYAVGTLAYDFGVLYKTGFRSLNLALSIRNFSQELRYEEENFELPLTFRIGVMMDIFDLTSLNPNMHSFIFSVDTERPRDFSEQIKVGGEYLFMNTFALRAGYIYPSDEQGFNAGIGLYQSLGGINFGFDYAYSEFGVFGDVNRFSLHVNF
jgi:hypothetical protein